MMTLVKNAISMIQHNLNEYLKEGVTIPKDIELIIDNLMLFATVWGIASAVDESYRKHISDFLLKVIRAP